MYLTFLGFNLLIWNLEKMIVLFRTFLFANIFNLFSNSVQDSSKNKFRNFMLLEVEESKHLVPQGLKFLSRFLFFISLQILSCEKKQKNKKLSSFCGKNYFQLTQSYIFFPFRKHRSFKKDNTFTQHLIVFHRAHAHSSANHCSWKELVHLGSTANPWDLRRGQWLTDSPGPLLLDNSRSHRT